jgi:hypothetical protein
MTRPLLTAMFFTVALLVVTTYFLMGSVPLLVLKHDTAMDARFIRAFYNTYYLAALWICGLTAMSYAWAHKPYLALGAIALAIVAVMSRRIFLPQMDALRVQIEARSAQAIALNGIQLVLIVWTLIRVSMDLR